MNTKINSHCFNPVLFQSTWRHLLISHAVSSPSPPAFNPSQHQGLCQWVLSSHQMAKVLELQLQHQSFQWISRNSEYSDWFSLGLTGLISLQSQGLSTPQFKSISFSSFSLLYSSTLISIHDYWKNHGFDYTELCWQSNASAF